MNNQNEDLKPYHSLYTSNIKPYHYNDASKSDIYIPPHNQLSYTCQNKAASAPPSVKLKHTGYYKRYVYDEVPVRDDASYVIHTDDDRGDYCCLTPSHLDRLETTVFNDMSRELRTGDSFKSMLESNINFLKTTIQEIFDNFNTSMRDYDLYKQKINEIFSKNEADSIAEKDFIKDMIRHIMSSETSLDKLESEEKETIGAGTIESNTQSNMDNAILLESLHSLVEAYENYEYFTDSSVNNNTTTTNKKSSRKQEMFNTLLLSSPCVEIRMNDRQLLSEINIKNRSIDELAANVASAEDIKKLAAKKLELENYGKHQEELPDRDIPVKVSFPKKNIHLNEDFACEKEVCEKDVGEKSFISKFCSFLCKKLRKM